MAKELIKTSTLSDEELETAKKIVFQRKDFTLPAGVKLVIGNAEIAKFEGISAECPIINFYYLNDWDSKKNAPKKGANAVIVFIKAMSRIVRDYQSEVVDIDCEIRAEIISLLGKTIGEVIDFYNGKIGAVVETTEKFYKTLSRKGEVFGTSKNGYIYIK